MAEKENTSKTKRVFSVVCTVISVIIFVFVGLLIINMIVCRVQNKPVSFFGYSFSVVQTNSMEPEIMTGDLIVFKKVDYASLNVGDTIVFKADNNFKDGAGNSLEGYTIVHKIVSVTEDGLVTKGVNNLAEDGGFRTADDVYGLCISNSAAWGSIFSFLSKYGVVIIIFIIAVPIIVSQVIKIVKLSKEKNDDGDEGTDGEKGVDGTDGVDSIKLTDGASDINDVEDEQDNKPSDE